MSASHFRSTPISGPSRARQDFALGPQAGIPPGAVIDAIARQWRCPEKSGRASLDSFGSWDKLPTIAEKLKSTAGRR